MWFRSKVKKHMFIIIRYSLASKHKEVWTIGQNNTFEEYCNKLFDDKRLDLREKLFKTITLPSLISLKQNTSIDLTLLVLTSSLLPSNYLDRLNQLLMPYSWAKVYVMQPNNKSIDMVGICLEEELRKYKQRVCFSTTRLDDDDALAPYFSKELEKYLTPNFKGFCVTFAKGYAGIYENETIRSFYEHYVPKISMGLSYIDVYDPKVKEINHIYAIGDHTRVDYRSPTILDSRKPMYIRTLHPANDSYNKLDSRFKMVPNTDDIKNLFSINI